MIAVSLFSPPRVLPLAPIYALFFLVYSLLFLYVFSFYIPSLFLYLPQIQLVSRIETPNPLKEKSVQNLSVYQIKNPEAYTQSSPPRDWRRKYEDTDIPK